MATTHKYLIVWEEKSMLFHYFLIEKIILFLFWYRNLDLIFSTKKNKKNLYSIKRNIHCEGILLQREIPMAWGTTIDNLTPKINPFLYARKPNILH